MIERLAHSGIYVPKDILEQVEFDCGIFRKKGDESLWRRLDEEFPKMPHADKIKVHRILSSRYPVSAERISLEIFERTVYNYCRDSYTPFESLRKKASLNEVEIREVHERFRDTIASWRGQE